MRHVQKVHFWFQMLQKERQMFVWDLVHMEKSVWSINCNHDITVLHWFETEELRRARLFTQDDEIYVTKFKLIKYI